ncbi:hypothetical protein [Bryobacter aggregatus]|uniref:hypothetical protein n=1 Tax=Bryobacter aggregatus TaxID=360054 RepID=UPI0004E21646|nr:hypothetical protein [Bryobacter aggregatus]
MDAMLWMFLPLLVAAGSALLSFFIMQSKLEVAVSKERESMAEARAVISTHARTMEETMRATEESARRKALDEFLADFRVEERHYVRESKSLFLNRKSMVLQERLYFRNIPLSNWVEHEMVIEDGGDIQKLAKACSVFSTRSVSNESANAAAQLGTQSSSIQMGPPQLAGMMSSVAPAKLLAMDVPAQRKRNLAG